MILAQFLKERLPRRFDAESGIVIGASGKISKQTDLIIYDALNSPVYRKGPRVNIIPRDNVAAVIEVKYKLNKEQLKDAAEKIASVKQIQPSPISNLDQPVTFSPLITSNSFGCVFAYDSYTSLDALAENLKDINEKRDSSEWIDHITVVSKGSLSYAIQFPFNKDFSGWFGGMTEPGNPVFPVYVHLTKDWNADLALNQFYLRLMTHLAFFRRRTSIDFEGVLGSEQRQAMTMQGYQHNLAGSLVPAEDSHIKVNSKILSAGIIYTYLVIGRW